MVGDVTVVDVGPVTEKRFDDLTAQLHLFLVREHEKEFKKIYQLCNMELSGASLVLTAEEIALLDKFLKEEDDSDHEETTNDQNDVVQNISIDMSAGEPEVPAWLSNIETRGTIM